MELRTIKIKGKAYVEVFERVRAFRMLHPSWTIETAILSNTKGVATMQATVKDETGRVLATGHAFEKQNSTFINQTSYIENCETSAVGRALAMLGIGIESAIASAEEVANAVNNAPGKTTVIAAPLETVFRQADRTQKIRKIHAMVSKLGEHAREMLRGAYPDGTKGMTDTELDEIEQQIYKALQGRPAEQVFTKEAQAA